MTRLIRGVNNVPKLDSDTVLTIGNFDGVHLGHQALLSRLKTIAHKENLKTLVIIFEPQPQEILMTEARMVPRLTRFREKFHLLSKAKIDFVLVLRFTPKFADLTPEQFIDQVIIQSFRPKVMVLGEDFKFGKGRSGDLIFMQGRLELKGIRLEIFNDFKIGSYRVSSTLVRKALAKDDQKEVLALLGRRYTMEGRIIKGKQLGRQLGFPTANIFVHRKLSPVLGIYIVRMHGYLNKTLPGVANVGTRPAVNGKKTLLEVYLFNFSENIYGKYVTIEFIKKLRDEKYFSDLTSLKKQIEMDADEAFQFFKSTDEL